MRSSQGACMCCGERCVLEVGRAGCDASITLVRCMFMIRTIQVWLHCVSCIFQWPCKLRCSLRCSLFTQTMCICVSADLCWVSDSLTCFDFVAFIGWHIRVCTVRGLPGSGDPTTRRVSITCEPQCVLVECRGR